MLKPGVLISSTTSESTDGYLLHGRVLLRLRWTVLVGYVELLEIFALDCFQSCLHKDIALAVLARDCRATDRLYSLGNVSLSSNSFFCYFKLSKFSLFFASRRNFFS